VTTFCVLCAAPVPPERAARRAVTCSKEHQKRWREHNRKKRFETRDGRCKGCRRKLDVPAAALHERSAAVGVR
jgi:hypothetical protein